MSSLLEEAIVDAKALKEAALKNAENVVLEKYSGEVKKALDTLLEQEELEEGGEDETLTEFTDDIPYAFQNEELDEAPEDEIVEIDFDALKARLEEEDEVVEEEDLNDALEMADDIAGGEMAPELDASAAEDTAELGAESVTRPEISLHWYCMESPLGSKDPEPSSWTSSGGHGSQS